MQAYRVEDIFGSVEFVGAKDAKGAVKAAFGPVVPLREITSEKLRQWEVRVRDRNGAYTYFA